MAGMVVKNNLSALSTLNVLNANQTRLSKSLKKVSSGMRINSAADDASGYAISERMRAQIRSLDQANRNTQNGSSMLKVAEGAVGSTVELLKTLKEKVINAANDTNTDEDRATIQKELDQSIDQINDNANVTYNGKYLVDGSKNSQGSATFTSLTNKSLSTDTKAYTLLTNLKDRTGASLGIQSSDRVTVSYVQNGKTYTTTYDVADTSLQDMFSHADDVNEDLIDFATRTNPAYAKIIGATDPAAARQAEQAAQGWANQTTRDEMIKANQWNAEYQSKLGSLGTAYTALSSAVAAQIATYRASSASAWQGDALETAWNGWMTTSGIGSYKDPANVSSYSSLDNELNHNPAFTTVWSGYKSAYSGLTNWMGTHDLSTLTLPTAPDVSAAGASYSETYDTSSYENYAKSATKVYNEAKAVARSMSGPVVLEGSAVGLSRAGDTVYTATRENAVSVMANNEGVKGQIAGFTVSITDSQGNIRKTANASLDAWTETVRAENESKNDNALVLQTGTRANQAIKIALSDMRSEALGLKGDDGQTLNIGNQKNANAAINVLDNAVQKALDEQTKIGSIQSRLEYTAANLTTASENVQASESAIRDADMAKEMTEYARNNVLMQAAQYMLAQANQNSSSVLGLLQ